MLEIQFTKMHGAGNDFVFVDCLKTAFVNLGSLAKQLCDRRFGVGADQLLTVHPSKVADFRMEIYNAGDSPVTLAAMSLSDDLAVRGRWELPVFMIGLCTTLGLLLECLVISVHLRGLEIPAELWWKLQRLCPRLSWAAVQLLP